MDHHLLRETHIATKHVLSVVVLLAFASLQLTCDEPAKAPILPKPIPAPPKKAESRPASINAVPPNSIRQNSYEFNVRFAIHAIPLWDKLLAPYKGKPNVRFLEIGLGEGETTFWMLDNILTHPSSSMVGFDVFVGPLKDRFYKNLEVSGWANKIQIFLQRSQEKLMDLPPNSFDIIYVDGSHLAPDVLTDAVLSWPLLKTGGLLIFDDYLMATIPPGPDRLPENSAKLVHYGTAFLPMELNPRVAADAFVTAFRNSLEIVYRGYQLWVKKKSMEPCLSLGEYRYCWDEKKLYRAKKKEAVSLTRDEQSLIEGLFVKRPFGEIDFVPEDAIRNDPKFVALASKLKLPIAQHPQ